MKTCEVKHILFEKAKTILIISLICAFCAATYKWAFTPTITIQGNFIYSRIVRLEGGKSLVNPNIPINYLGLINMDGTFQKFIEATDDKIFNYSKINSGWKRTILQNKITWFRQQTILRNYNDNVFEFVFVIPSMYISDLKYLKDNINSLMDAFVSNAQQSIGEIDSNATIKVIRNSVIEPQEIKNNKRVIALKNAVYGFIAGMFFSIAVIFGVRLFKES